MEKALYRIIDANFNRAREACRVMEEFCRFVLNSASLTERAKQLRHRLSAAIARLDNRRLIASRDTTGDVGVGQKVDNQLHRTDLKDCLIAACKRLTEALRTLAELVQSLNPPVAEEIEKLRYCAYTLEKDIIIFSDTTEKFKAVELYIVITSSLPAEVLSLTNYCIGGGADCIQLRAKNIADDGLFALAGEFVKSCKEGNVISIINDRVDIAVAADADGVHLGQNDLPVEQARRLEGRPLIIGKSTHSPEQLRLACLENPTYVALGPVFTTDTKPTAPSVGLEYVTQASKIISQTGIAGVAIGGINLNNIETVLQAGAQKIAVCSAVTMSPNPMEMCRKLKKKIVDFRSSQRSL